MWLTRNQLALNKADYWFGWTSSNQKKAVTSKTEISGEGIRLKAVTVATLPELPAYWPALMDFKLKTALQLLDELPAFQPSQWHKSVP